MLELRARKSSTSYRRWAVGVGRTALIFHSWSHRRRVFSLTPSIHRAMHEREPLKRRRRDRDYTNSGLERFKR